MARRPVILGDSLMPYAKLIDTQTAEVEGLRISSLCDRPETDDEQVSIHI
jgi:hypothetical protein